MESCEKTRSHEGYGEMRSLGETKKYKRALCGELGSDFVFGFF